LSGSTVYELNFLLLKLCFYAPKGYVIALNPEEKQVVQFNSLRKKIGLQDLQTDRIPNTCFGFENWNGKEQRCGCCSVFFYFLVLINNNNNNNKQKK
jgi:hypothetical protein